MIPISLKMKKIWPAFRDSVNDGNTYAGKYIELRANKTYDLSGQAWTPIGNSARGSIVEGTTKYFAGAF